MPAMPKIRPSGTVGRMPKIRPATEQRSSEAGRDWYRFGSQAGAGADSQDGGGLQDSGGWYPGSAEVVG